MNLKNIAATGKFFTCVLLLTLFSSTTIFAAGFQLFHELSAKGTGTGAAMSARDDVAESAWFNPAASSFMETASATTGMAAVFPSMTLYDGKTDPEMKNMVYPVPHLYMATPILDQFGVSFAANSPYGLTTEWDEEWVGRYYAQYTRLTSFFFTPAVSWSPVDWLSIGAGIQVAYVDAEMKKNIPVTSLQTEVRTKVEGDDWGQGFMVSVMLKPDEKWNFGFTYRSEVEFDLKGDASYDYPPLPEPYTTMLKSAFLDSSLELPLTLPRTVSIALSTTAIRDWRFSAEFLWTGWSSYNELNFKYDNAPGQGSVSGSVINEKNWNDVWSVHLGAEYSLTDSWTLRAGYVWDESPIESDYRDPSLPTNDRHILGFGLGWQWRRIEIDASYSYLMVEDCKPGYEATPSLNGTYEGDAHITNISFTWNF